MATLNAIFAATGGPDKNSPALLEAEPTPAFLEAFTSTGNQQTGANGSGPILNANANLLPDRSDQFRDSSVMNDFKLGNGLGISRAFRKQDSQGGQVNEGFQGLPYPNKQFGRSTVSHDQVYDREANDERARMAIKKMGYKPDEAPKGAAYFPWQWNNKQAMGEGGGPIGNPNQYNRNYGLPDADAAARRLYEPTPSRRTKMVSTSAEVAALRPQRTLMHPMTVVSQDRQREKEQRVSRNVDVAEAVIYEGIAPRGMAPVNGVEAHKVWGETSVLRIPVGNNETGDRSQLGIWRNGHDPHGAMLDSSLQDRLQLQKDRQRYLEGQDPTAEITQWRHRQRSMLDGPRGAWFDPNKIQPSREEYPHDQSGINGPLQPNGGVF